MSDTPAALPTYPLLLTPIYKEKVWGGRTLERLGRNLPGDPDAKIGESWELVDLAQTSASGGGGGGATSVVANGPLAGQTLGQLIADDRAKAALMGDLPLSPEGGFPLLLKYLDASENLSVQVHPSAAYAAEHDDAFLKSEAWFIVDCEPGAAIYKGIHEGVTPDQLRAAIAQNTDDAVVPLMVSVPVRPGDCHYLPSGTCHALGGGILVAEVQTPSDTTFRVYDWGRTGRELHVDAAMQCIDFGPADTTRFEPDTRVAEGAVRGVRRVVCEYFRIDHYEADAGATHDVPAGETRAVMVLAGAVDVDADGAEPTPAPTGSTLLIPAATRGVSLHASDDAAFLLVSFPQAGQSQLA
ncbi:MAG: type I phosphomannose isomerase catalytic subunit [Planctomycetota bacterium]